MLNRSGISKTALTATKQILANVELRVLLVVSCLRLLVLP